MKQNQEEIADTDQPTQSLVQSTCQHRSFEAIKIPSPSEPSNGLIDSFVGVPYLI
jgi:hypothetical protein